MKNGPRKNLPIKEKNVMKIIIMSLMIFIFTY